MRLSFEEMLAMPAGEIARRADNFMGFRAPDPTRLNAPRCALSKWKDTGRFYELVKPVDAGYSQLIAFARVAATALVTRGTTTFSGLDTGGTNRTFNARTNDAAVGNHVDYGSGDFLRVAWGDNGTAVDPDNDYSIGNQISGTLTPTVGTPAPGRLTFAGAELYAGAGATAREIVAYGRPRETGNSNRTMLLDRAVIPDTTVNSGETVTVSYDWDWSGA